MNKAATRRKKALRQVLRGMHCRLQIYNRLRNRDMILWQAQMMVFTVIDDWPEFVKIEKSKRLMDLHKCVKCGYEGQMSWGGVSGKLVADVKCEKCKETYKVQL
jgi:hypothetical protein